MVKEALARNTAVNTYNEDKENRQPYPKKPETQASAETTGLQRDRYHDEEWRAEGDHSTPRRFLLVVQNGITFYKRHGERAIFKVTDHECSRGLGKQADAPIQPEAYTHHRSTTE